MDLTYRIIIGDSRDMSIISDTSVHLIVTSPPYWMIKNYADNPDQIGHNQTYEEYTDSLNCVWKECYRILHEGCKMCINIGDQFLSAKKHGRYRIVPIRTDIINYCTKELGMDYMGAFIWQKATNTKTSGGGTLQGSTYHPRDGQMWIDYEFILIFKKLGSKPKVTEKQKEKSKLTKKERFGYFRSHWNFGGARQDDHPAPFPEELPKRLIKMYSFWGETICDPFLGSGTTMTSAKKLERSCIGFEINETYVPVIKEKTNWGTSNIFTKMKFKIKKIQ